ncbi:energy-coupling factor transporter transmembrane component T family protein [uncultured Jatrophihabitans sp.]|uniref:energy-coupling factor transporter transmembrane component T family protein n=1 Tax=uncultured Jatrophihabitans sp. TaxID=1610747 RepID=UPI0035C9D29D
MLTSGVMDIRGTRLNPVTKIVALAVLSLPVLITGDPVVALVLLAGQLLALPALGLWPGVLVRYGWPFLVALAGIWAANYLASGDIAVVLPITARVAALALPGIVLVLTTEPVDLADALVQVWRAPARFAYGALAAFRLMPLLGADWVSLRRARRARGLAAGANPLRAVGVGFGLLFALMVTAIRRAVRLAAAMDARGFGAGSGRTFARPSRLRKVDWATMAAAVLLAVAAVVVGALA